MSDKKYELRKQIKSVRWMLFWVVLAQFAAEVAVKAAVSFMQNPPHEYIQIAFIELFAIGVPILLYARTAWRGGTKSARDELCLKACKARFVIFALILGISGQFVMMLLNVPANYIMTTFFQKEAAEAVPVAKDLSEILPGIASVVIIPAVLEEFWMRGIIFRAYSRCNTVAAVLFTGLTFALLHLRAAEFAGFFFMGVVASIILIKSRSLYAAMIYHGASNLTALLFGAYIMPAIIDKLFLVFAVFVIVFAAVFTVLVRQKGGMQNNKVFRTGPLVATSIFSMPVLLSAATMVIKYFLLKVTG